VNEVVARKQLNLPPDVARAFVKDMRASSLDMLSLPHFHE
jgi:hypothetical protein